MTSWMIESRGDLGSDLVLAEQDSGALFWTTDRSCGLAFAEKHLAERFAANRLPEPFAVVERIRPASVCWATANMGLRASRDTMDAFKAREHAACAMREVHP